MRQVLCVVLLIALGESAVRYPRGYGFDADAEYGDKDKIGASHDLTAGETIKGGIHIQEGAYDGNIDVVYQSLNKKDDEIHKNENEELRVDLDAIAVKDTEHSSSIESGDNTGIITQSSDSVIESAPINAIQSSYSANTDDSTNVKSSSNIPCGPIIETDTSSTTKSSSSEDEENSGVKVNDDNIIVKGSYSSVSENSNVKNGESTGSVIDTVLSFFTNRHEHDKIKSSSSNDDVHGSKVESNDTGGSIINSLLSFFTNERYEADTNNISSSTSSGHKSDVNTINNNRTLIEAQSSDSTTEFSVNPPGIGDAVHSSDVDIIDNYRASIEALSSDSTIENGKADSVYSSDVKVIDNNRTSIAVQSSDSTIGDGNNYELGSSLSGETEHSSDIKSDNSTGHVIETMFSIDEEGSGEHAEINSDTEDDEINVSLNKTRKPEAELSSDFVIEDISDSLIKTILIDTANGQEASEVIDSTSSSDSKLINKANNIYDNGSTILRTVLDFFSGHGNDVKELLSSSPSSNGVHNSDQDQNNVGDSSVSSDTAYSTDVKSIDKVSTLEMESNDSKIKNDDAKSSYSNESGYSSEVKNSDNFYANKPVSSDSSIVINYGGAIESNSNSDASQNIEIRNDLIIKKLPSDSIIGDDQSSLIESNASSFKSRDNNDSITKDITSDLIANKHHDIKSSYSNDAVHVGDAKTSDKIELSGSSNKNDYETTVVPSSLTIESSYVNVNSDSDLKTETNDKNDSITISDNKNSVIKGISSDYTINLNEHSDVTRYSNNAEHIGDIENHKDSSNQKVADINTLVSDINNTNDNSKTSDILIGDANDKDMENSKNGYLQSSSSNDFDYSKDIIKDKNNWNNSEGTHYHGQSTDKDDIHHYIHGEQSQDIMKDKNNWNDGEGTHHHSQSIDKDDNRHYINGDESKHVSKDKDDWNKSAGTHHHGQSADKDDNHHYINDDQSKHTVKDKDVWNKSDDTHHHGQSAEKDDNHHYINGDPSKHTVKDKDDWNKSEGIQHHGQSADNDRNHHHIHVDQSKDIVKDKDNGNKGDGTNHHGQSGDKYENHHYIHVISHKHSEESSESSSSSEESEESKESYHLGHHHGPHHHNNHHDDSKESDECRDSSHRYEHDPDNFNEQPRDSSDDHKYGHSITKRNSDKNSLTLKKSETKQKDEIKNDENIKSVIEGQRNKRGYGGYYNYGDGYNYGRNYGENREKYKHGYYRNGHGDSDSDSDSTSEERSEKRSWHRNSWHSREGGWRYRSRRSLEGDHSHSGDSFDNSNEGGEREY